MSTNLKKQLVIVVDGVLLPNLIFSVHSFLLVVVVVLLSLWNRCNNEREREREEKMNKNKSENNGIRTTRKTKTRGISGIFRVSSTTTTTTTTTYYNYHA